MLPSGTQITSAPVAILRNENRITGQFYAQHIEHENLSLRNRLKQLNQKKAPEHSKSAEMHDYVVVYLLSKCIFPAIYESAP